MKASAPDSTTGWTLELTPNEYGERILPTASAQHKRLNALSVSGKPRVGNDRVTWEFWGWEHLQLAVEVCKYVMLTMES